MSTLTEAEKIARYDAARLSPAPAPADVEIDIARACDKIIAEAKAEEEDRPIPPVPLGYSPDKPFIGHIHRDVSIIMDRRDGGLMIARTGEIGGRLLEIDEIYALRRFFQRHATEDVIMWHWRKWIRAHGSAKFVELLDWIDEHFAKEEAETA